MRREEPRIVERRKGEVKNGEKAKGGRGGRAVWGVGKREQHETTRNYTRREQTKTDGEEGWGRVWRVGKTLEGARGR